jgi:hypothetical protein
MAQIYQQNSEVDLILNDVYKNINWGLTANKLVRNIEQYGNLRKRGWKVPDKEPKIPITLQSIYIIANTYNMYLISDWLFTYKVAPKYKSVFCLIQKNMSMFMQVCPTRLTAELLNR